MQVVVGIIMNSHQQILIAQRPQEKYKGGLWEFPGGKVEPNETLFDALQREMKEELGIHVVTAEPWLITPYDYGDRVVLLNTWRVTQFTGEPAGQENQPIVWVSKDSLDQFQFPEGNREILNILREANNNKDSNNSSG
jgi:8-oxo-dGTP diphosphatase